ncbi:unnamed protein product [Orchesella dallaii]|uniref:C2H2-type domain-containing protein n=1 Tax=Orchesella dallaii TaxID=48710 RepID=A0ABP1RSK2_9HEXA
MDDFSHSRLFSSIPRPTSSSKKTCFFLPTILATSCYSSLNLKVDNGNNDGSLEAICDICGKGFSSEAYVNRHKKSVHQKTNLNEEHQQCPKCPKRFNDMKNFWQHIVLVHEGKGDGNDVNEEGGGSGGGGVLPKDLQPRELDPRVNEMWTHSDDDGPTCKECGKSFSDVAGVKKHIKHIHLKLRTRECPKCGKKFRDTHNMNRHMKDVHALSKSDFPCNLCSIVLCSADGLFRHKRNVHGVKDEPIPIGTPPTQCPYCSEIFYHQGYEAHIRELHSEHYEEFVEARKKGPVGRYPSTCQICKQTFSDGQTLQRHITRVHDQAGAFRCSECGKNFGDPKELRTHLASHQNTILEPYVKPMLRAVFGTVCNSNMTCGICQTVVNNSLEGKLHIYIKHPEKFDEMVTKEAAGWGCSFCTERFVTKDEIIQHIDFNHPDQNLPTCGLCGHKELKQRDMNYHYKRHHAQAPRYVCEVCQATFTQKLGLKKHVKREHSDESAQCPYCPEKHVKVKLHVTKKHPERAAEYGEIVKKAVMEEREGRKRFNQFLAGKPVKKKKMIAREGEEEDSGSNSEIDGELSDNYNDGLDHDADDEEGELEKKPIPSECVVQQTKPVALEKYKIEKRAEQPHVIEIQRIEQPVSPPPAEEPEQILPDDGDSDDEVDIKPDLLTLKTAQEAQNRYADEIEEEEEDYDDDVPNEEEERPTVNLILCRRTLAVEVNRLTESEIRKWKTSKQAAKSSIKKGGSKSSQKRRRRRH